MKWMFDVQKGTNTFFFRKKETKTETAVMKMIFTFLLLFFYCDYEFYMQAFFYKITSNERDTSQDQTTAVAHKSSDSYFP